MMTTEDKVDSSDQNIQDDTDKEMMKITKMTNMH